MHQLVSMLFEAGAAKVHVRVSSPPIVSPCFYGIDMADEEQLAAAHRSVEQMRELIGATSLHYLSLEGMQAATRLPEASVCRACFTRNYPTRVPAERNLAKLRFEPAARYQAADDVAAAERTRLRSNGSRPLRGPRSSRSRQGSRRA